MFTKKSFLLVLLMAILPLSLTRASSPYVFHQVFLSVRYVDPTINQQGHPRSPIETPEIGIDGNTLNFVTSCDGCILRLVNEDGEVDYTTVIPTNTTIFELPSYLEGTYEIQIISGDYCFYGEIVLE